MRISKSRLLGTTALAAAVSLAAGAALAEEKAAEEEMMEPTPPTLSLGGYYFMDAHFADEDGRNNDGPMRMVHDSEVHFNAAGEMANGIKVGAHIEFEGSGGFRVDDHWITLDGGWGQVMMGATDGVNVKTMVVAPQPSLRRHVGSSDRLVLRIGSHRVRVPLRSRRCEARCRNRRHRGPLLLAPVQWLPVRGRFPSGGHQFRQRELWQRGRVP